MDRLIDMGEVEIHDEPVPLTGLGAIIERTEKAVLFKKRRPGTGRDRRQDRGKPQTPDRARSRPPKKNSTTNISSGWPTRKPVVEIPSGDAPVHAVKITGKDVDLTKLPFYPHHAYDGSCYMSSATDYVIDPATGRRNVGCRRLSLRNRYETGTNVTAPSDLKRIYTACVARGEKLPITFTVGTHPLDFVAATMRHPGDELSLVAHAARRARRRSQEPHQRHPGAGRRRDDARGLSRRARLCRAGRTVRRIHGLLRLDPHGPGVSLHRHHHAPRRAAPHAAARLGVRARPDRQPEHQRDPHRSRGDAHPQGRRARSGRGLSAVTPRAARTRCASRSGSAASARRGSRSRRCSAASRGSSTSSCSTRTSTSATTCRSNGRSARASRPTRIW